MTQDHQGVKNIKKTLLLTAITIDKTTSLYAYISDVKDAVIRGILQKIDTNTIEIHESCNPVYIPEIYASNFYDNGLILEWWLQETDCRSGMADILGESLQVEFRFSFYDGSDGLSRILDRGSFLLTDIDDTSGAGTQIALNLVDFLQQNYFA